ncbi:hypothetical protein GGF32_006245 [Allomyces javanicus]|nr:hypothetical protein GGF32_006245 [Allomyces javanicus]
MLDIFKRPVSSISDDEPDPLPVRTKIKYENKYHMPDEEYFQGRWVVDVFRHFPDQRMVQPREILYHATDERFVVRGRWKDPHQGIRSYISLWNKKYREMHPEVDQNKPCTDGCERKGAHRICSKGRKPVYYWMRSQYHDELYTDRTQQAAPRRVPNRPPKMPRRRPEFALVKAPFGHDFSKTPVLDPAAAPPTAKRRKKKSPAVLSAQPVVTTGEDPIFTAQEREAAKALFQLGDDPVLFGHPVAEEPFPTGSQLSRMSFEDFSKCVERVL